MNQNKKGNTKISSLRVALRSPKSVQTFFSSQLVSWQGDQI
jgi:hypothetical protein